MMFKSTLFISFVLCTSAYKATPPLNKIVNGKFQKVEGVQLRPHGTSGVTLAAGAAKALGGSAGGAVGPDGPATTGPETQLGVPETADLVTPEQLDADLVTAGTKIFASTPAEGASDKDVETAWAPVTIVSGVEEAKSISAHIAPDGSILLSAYADGDNNVAYGTYHDKLSDVGWGSLSVHTSPDTTPDTAVEDGVKMYAAGVIEGYLTAQRIEEFHKITHILHRQDAVGFARMPGVLTSFATTVTNLAKDAESADQADAATLKGQARVALLQTWGVRDGYTLKSGKTATMPDMFLLNSDGVIDELISALGGPATSLMQVSSQQKNLRGARNATVKPHGKMEPKRRNGHMLGHCTGLVKLADDNKELYFGHTTVECYSEMTRMWKVYDFPITGVAAKKISFSSYPGCISSTDDFLLMDSGLAVMETTLDIPEHQTYPASQSIPDFIRIMAANRLATTAKEWVDNMVASATGTYSSQWMVLDYNKFTIGEKLQDGAFYVLEQAPGATHFEDMSQHLNTNRFWSSYNRAWYDPVRTSTGDNQMVNMLKATQPAGAEEYSKDQTPRAQIVAAKQSIVNSLSDMRTVITRNKGNSETHLNLASENIPLHAISPRNDVSDTQGSKNVGGDPFGGVDGKITSSCLFKKQMAQAISSPSHSTLPAFDWLNDDGVTEKWPGYPRDGLPTKWNFGWLNVNPQDDMFSKLDNGECH